MSTTEVISEYELERGKPMPSKNHGLVQTYVGAAFLRYEKDYSVLTELTLDLGGRDMTPDLAVYPKLTVDWRHDEVKMTEPPLLVVEILSPRQSLDDLVLKAEAYFAAGIKSCWIVQPVIQSVAVLAPGKKPESISSGEVADPATSIVVPIDEIFR